MYASPIFKGILDNFHLKKTFSYLIILSRSVQEPHQRACEGGHTAAAESLAVRAGRAPAVRAELR